MLTGPFKEGRGESEGSDESVCRAAETESAADSLNEHVIAMCAYTCVYVCVYMCVCMCVCIHEHKARMYEHMDVHECTCTEYVCNGYMSTWACMGCMCVHEHVHTYAHVFT